MYPSFPLISEVERRTIVREEVYLKSHVVIFQTPRCTFIHAKKASLTHHRNLLTEFQKRRTPEARV